MKIVAEIKHILLNKVKPIYGGLKVNSKHMEYIHNIYIREQHLTGSMTPCSKGSESNIGNKAYSNRTRSHSYSLRGPKKNDYSYDYYMTGLIYD